MARDPRTDNEFRNRQPAKIRWPAKLTAAPDRADNCGLHFNSEAIITKLNLLTVRAHVSFIRSLARETMHRSAHDICLPEGKKYSEFTASFEVNQSARSCSRIFVPDATCRDSYTTVRIRRIPGCFVFAIDTARLIVRSRNTAFVLHNLFALDAAYLAHDHPLIITAIVIKCLRED